MKNPTTLAALRFDRGAFRYVLVAITAIAVYSNTFTADFVYDDSQAIVSNPVVTGQVSALQAWTLDFWGNPMNRGSHKSYRPLTTLSFRLNSLIFGMRPTSFHVTNVLLHALASCLLLAFIDRFNFFPKNSDAAVFASLLFAVHPIHCEAVAGVVGRADVLAAITVLIGMLLYERNQSVAVAAICTAVAVCFKETGIMLPPLIITYLVLHYRKSGRELRKSLLSLMGILLCATTIRHAINAFEAPSFSKSDNPTAHNPSALTRTLTFLYLPIFHLYLLIFPNYLCFDWSMDSISLVTSASDQRFLVSATVYFGLMWYGCVLLRDTGLLESLWLDDVKKGSSVWCRHSARSNSCSRYIRCTQENSARKTLFAFALMILPFIPASNLFYYVGFVAAERTLYLPSVGYCIHVGNIYSFFSKRYGRNVAVSTAFLLLFLHATKTFERNKDWENEEMLYRSALEINPPKAYSNLGRVYSLQGRTEEAEAAYKEALHYRPNMADTWYNLGVLHQDRKNFSQAIKCYQAAIRFRRSFAIAHLNLGTAFEARGDDQSATSVWQSCAAIDGSHIKAQREHFNAQTSCLYRLGKLLIRQRNLRRAQRILEEAVQKAPLSYPFFPSLLYSIGELADMLGQHAQAEKLFQSVIDVTPTHVPTLITMGHLCNRQNRTSESNDWFMKALAVAPNSADVHHHIGLAAALRGDVRGAEASYRNALKLVSTHLGTLHALATLLREHHRYSESEKILKKLKDNHPTAETLGDYGAILHLNGKIIEAKEFYRKSLDLDPGHSPAMENLRRLEQKFSSTKNS